MIWATQEVKHKVLNMVAFGFETLTRSTLPLVKLA